MKNITFERELSIYTQIYTLRTITNTKAVDKVFFDYCKKKEFFVLLVLYNKKGEIYFKSSGINQFALVGGTVQPQENVRGAVERTVKGLGISTTLEAVEPICLLENNYTCEDGCITHKGIAFMVQLPENATEFAKLTRKTLSNFKAFSDYQILSIFMERYRQMISRNAGDFQEDEIETNQKYQNRYAVHNQFVKRFLLTAKRKKKERLIQMMREKMGKPIRLLDVSCGDNSLLFSYVQEVIDRDGIIVANDISYSQIELIPPKDGVIFTQHNAISLPFRENAFDIVYCSNTLHHIPNEHALQSLLDSMISVGKKVIIYEIENPEITGGFPKFLNQYYYRGFLKDVGEKYLSEGQFVQLIEEKLRQKATIQFSSFRNIQGNYLIAEITKK